MYNTESISQDKSDESNLYEMIIKLTETFLGGGKIKY